MKVRLVGNNNVLKEVKVGFSWTTFFFGIFPALFRGDWKWTLIMLVAGLLTFGISWLVFPFVYNKLYLKDLVAKGYKPASEVDEQILVSKGIIVPSMN